MNIAELIEELSYCDQSAEAEIEINDVIYTLACVSEDSQGVYLQAEDPDKDYR